MAMDRDDRLDTTRMNAPLDRDMNLNNTPTDPMYDRDAAVYDRDKGGSNFLAFLIGGLVIAVGLLAFLFYDGGNSRDVNTTGSTAPGVERPATPAPTPATPATPTRPANPQ